MVKGGRWEEAYHFIYMPTSIDPAEVRKKMKSEEQLVSAHKDLQSSIVERDEISTNKKRILENFSINDSINKGVGVLPSEPFL